MNPVEPVPRPWGVTALSLFFGLGAAVSFTSLVALLFPGSVLEPMWRLNPRAREAFASMGPWALGLMVFVSALCALASIGLWRGRRRGYGLAVVLLSISLLGDLANALLGIEPRAWIGVPIAGLMLAFLGTTRVRIFFAARAGTPPH